MDDIDKKDLETIDIETPLDASSSPSPTFEAPRLKKSRKKLIITLIILVVLLATAGFAYYWFVMKEEPTEVAANETETTSQVQIPSDDCRDYAKEIIEKIRASEEGIKEEYPNSVVEDTEPLAPAYMYGENKYYVNGPFGYTLLITNPGPFNESFNAAGEQAAIAVLEKEDLIKSQKQSTATFLNDVVICNVTQSGYPVYISCANTRDYKTPSETVQPFAKAYFANPNAADESQIIFGQPVITNKSDGYKNATVSISGYSGTGGFAGLFSGKDTTWTYWTGSQSIIPCAKYNTLELQKAFEGDPCYVEGQSEDSVVIVTLTE